MYHINEHERQHSANFGAPTPKEVDAQEHTYEPERSDWHRPAPHGSDFLSLFLSKTVWLFGTGLVFLMAWTLGPRLVEHYNYAATKAKIQAEYDVASVALKNAPLSGFSTASEMVARRIRPSVVHISTISSKSQTPLEMRGFIPSEGQGSGVIISEDGYIVTNEHVVRDALRIDVVLSDRRTYSAKLQGVDVKTDLAVIKIDADNLIPATWGESDSFDVGSMVWAVGSPFGLEQSITFGILSAKHRKTNENHHQDLMQSDAAVNPGNSGGPLVNAQGEVVGINTSIVGQTYQGISFAVPSDLARMICAQLISEGEVTRGFLGVTPALVTPQHAISEGLPSLDGALIVDVAERTPAARAGFRPGDVITRWNGIPIDNEILLFRHVGLTPVNSEVEVVFWRDGEEHTVRLRVARNDQ